MRAAFCPEIDVDEGDAKCQRISDLNKALADSRAHCVRLSDILHSEEAIATSFGSTCSTS